MTGLIAQFHIVTIVVHTLERSPSLISILLVRPTLPVHAAEFALEAALLTPATNGLHLGV